MDKPIFFQDADELLRVLVTAPLLYAAVIVFIRVAGKRSTSKMNNFDWVVTVAIGSVTASGILLKDVSLAEALLAVGLLISLQWLVTRAVFDFGLAERAVKAEPALLLKDGELLRGAMARERVTAEEIKSALRSQGLASLKDARWVVLETDATLSVIPRGAADKGAQAATAMDDVPGAG